MQIFDIEQNTPDWDRARAGIPTSSMFKDVMARTPGGKAYGKTRQTYMRKLAGEILTDAPMENYSNADMQRGHDMEDEARKYYAFMTDSEPAQIGFVRNGQKGSSPDSFIGENGILEIKTKAPHLLIELIEKDQFPPEHKAQCQGQLWVCEREWVDLACYWPGLPMFVKRAHRDEDYIRNLSEEVDRFNEELAALVEKIRAYGKAA